VVGTQNDLRTANGGKTREESTQGSRCARDPGHAGRWRARHRDLGGGRIGARGGRSAAQLRSNGTAHYKIELGIRSTTPRALPADGCRLAHKDLTGIYSDGSGSDACLDDAQIANGADRMVKNNALPVDLAHIYVVYLPKHVETCFLGGSTETLRRGFQACTINHEKTAGYCAYHTIAANGMVYANLSFPIYSSPVGFTCGSDARIAFRAIESPNGDPDAAGTFYNQTINGGHYLPQEEFSNQDFADTGGGCVQGSNQEQ
jgi:hypothetical protein